jgi:hypothetical protein
MPSKPSFKVNFEQIKQKQARLEIVKAELKSEFVGIDYIIDELINYIQIWYLMPEILTRPIVVNLWGMTGVGKTDLVRKLVNKLSFQDRFVEVELSHGEGNWNSTVSRILESNGVHDGKPAIVLFDEIQRFYTIDPDGKPLISTKFQDFWELLSDGRLAKRDVKEEMQDYIHRFLFSKRQRQRRKDQENSEEAPIPPEDTTLGIWQAQSIKKLFGIEENVMTLAEMRDEDVLDMMQRLTKRKKVYEPIDHSKTLIIISGNLDEAYSMASDTAEADVDADIFRAYTEKITIVDIKNALSQKFKPEQVARFGNIHLIYRSLQRVDFEELIRREIAKIIQKNKEYFGIEVSIGQAINQLIYQNGVFPVQGVRPVFSSVMDVLESNLSKFVFEALMQKQTSLDLNYSFEKNQLMGTLSDGHQINFNYVGRVDKIRESNPIDVTANVSVHESGHAVVYGLLFGLSPLQLKSKVASSYAAGFTFPHQIHQTKENLLKKIKVFLAGGLAEELIFGENNATTGRIGDREEATKLASDFIRKFGFHDDFSAFYDNSPLIQMDPKVTDPTIENLIKQQVAETKVILSQHTDFLIKLSQRLLVEGSLSSAQIADIAAQFGHQFVIKEETYKLVANYSERLNG